MGESKLRGALDLIQRGFADGTLHGVAAVIAPGEPTLYGISGTTRPEGKKLERTSRFRLAGLSKVIVQLALLRLSQDGRLSIDEPLATYRPGFAVPWAETVTLRQLVTSRSGLPRERPGANPIESGVVYDASGSALGLLDGLTEIGPEVAPDSQTATSNLGYFHLGGVLEAVCGKSLEGCLNELVFGPAGMTNSGLFGADELDGEVHVFGHDRVEGGGLKPVGAFPVSVRYAAGGLYSTPEDLERLSLAILGNGFLGDAERQMFFSGFGRSESGRVRIAGRLPGFANVWVLSSSPPFSIVCLNNAVGGSADAVVSLVDQAAARLTAAAPSPAKDVDPLEAAGWKRVPSFQAIPTHPLLQVAESYVDALGTENSSALFDSSVRARGLDPAALTDEQRKGYQFDADQQFEEFNAHGPFRVAAWRPGDADRLEIYLAGPEGRATVYRFRPDPQGRKRALAIEYARIGFDPPREKNPYFGESE